MKRLAAICLLASACAMPAPAQARDKQPPVLNLDFKAEVQADGSLANVEPDASLAPVMQSMLRKQVAGWRYLPGTWQGKPVPAQVSQRVVVEAMPVTTGGYALRIKEVTGVPVVISAKRMPEGVRMLPPAYPPEAQRQGIEATLLYAMRRDAQGAPIEVELVDAQVPSNWRKEFDAASRQAIHQWRLQPVQVDGQAIDCRLLTPMTFRVGNGKAPPPRLDPDLRSHLSRFPDACPLPPTLETQVAGMFL